MEGGVRGGKEVHSAMQGGRVREPYRDGAPHP
jgi:hypothetical protein